MATGLVRLSRRAILSFLKADAGVLARVPAASIHGQVPLTTPTWPFIKLGAISFEPLDAACVAGGSGRITVHAFAKATRNGSGAITSTAEDNAGLIQAAIEAALHRAHMPLANGTMTLKQISSQLLVDGGEADAFHAITDFRARVIAS
jgi:hypothetical protein